MKLSKLAFSVVLGLAVSACSNQMSKDGSLEAAQQDYQNYEEITKQFSINEQWWRGYNDSQLNSLVDEAIANNLNLAKSAIAVNKALYNANLVVQVLLQQQKVWAAAQIKNRLVLQPLLILQPLA